MVILMMTGGVGNNDDDGKLLFNHSCHREYMSERKPSAKLKEIISLLVNFYIPNYFNIKTHPTIQDGAPNLFFMLTLARGLKPGSKATVERVLQNNSFFAHHENILIAMLRDESEEVRRRAVLFIRYGND